MFKNSAKICRIGALGALSLAGSAWSQVCSYDIAYSPAPTTSPVPSLSMLGVALLVAIMAVVAWRQGRFPGAKFIATTFMVGAALLANQGGGGLVQQAYATVMEIVLSNPAGGNTPTQYPAPGDTLTFRNGTTVPLRISSVTPALSACGAGTLLAPGATCSTAVAGCPGALMCGENEVGNTDGTACICQPGLARINGICITRALCPADAPPSSNPDDCGYTSGGGGNGGGGNGGGGNQGGGGNRPKNKHHKHKKNPNRNEPKN